MDKVKHGGSIIFSNINDPDEGILESKLITLLKPYMRKKSLKKNEEILTAGSLKGYLFAILSGKVKIYNIYDSGKEKTHYIFGPGVIFGFMPLIDEYPYPASAKVLEEGEALILGRESLKRILREEREISILLLRILSRRLREALYQIDFLSGKDTKKKVASALTSLLPEINEEKSEMVIDFPVSSHKLANLTGITPESFSRELNQLINEKILQRLGMNSFKVLNSRELKLLSEK